MTFFQKYCALSMVFLSLNLCLFAQKPHRHCATIEMHEEQLRQNPALKSHLEKHEQHTHEAVSRPQLRQRSGLVKIPVVVHIVSRADNPIENISDAQVLSQIEALNRDFRRLNTDQKNTPAEFLPIAADCDIEFHLAKRTPDGKATTGIMRHIKNRTLPFGKNEDIKRPNMGGVAPWDASKYLNIWVCPLSGGVLGYSSLPATDPLLDGVVIDYRYFGTSGDVVEPYNLGRTTTHEIGHWLNLRHTWGDADCGDDKCGDTPPQYSSNYGCPNTPQSTCNGLKTNDMYMNFMDYTDDACMNIFTRDQKLRIHALFTEGGARASIKNSDALLSPELPCLAASNIQFSDITTQSATVSFEKNASNLASVLDFRPKNNTVWQSVSVNSAENFVLKNLTPNTEYALRITNSCVNNKIAQSGTTHFSTKSLMGKPPVSIQNTTICADIFEPNDFAADAKPLLPDSSVQASLDDAKDTDCFFFTNSANKPHVAIEAKNLPNGICFDILNIDNQLIKTIKKDGLVEGNAILNDLLPGIYTFKVRAGEGWSEKSTCYSLTFHTSKTAYAEAPTPDFATRARTTNSVILYPNPVADELTVEYTQTLSNARNTEGVALTLSLFDLSGKMLKNTTHTAPSTVNFYHIDVRDLSDGVYVLLFKTGSRSLLQRILVRKEF